VFDAALRRIIDPPLDRMAAHVAARGVSANAVTVGAFACGVLAMVAIIAGQMAAALCLLSLNRLGDGLDGAIARRRGSTDLGGFLDIVLDFIVYSGIVFAFAVHDPARNALAAAFLIFSFMGTGSSFLAFAIMAAKRQLETTLRGHKSLYYLGGLTEGTETILALALFCLVPESFPALATGFGVLCWMTTVARITAASRMLR
jgi:phosphatidylglycerophosphate synthase